MTNNWNLTGEPLAAGSTCPTPDCREINFAYHWAGGEKDPRRELWEFTCSRCGLEYATFDEDLLFHSVRREWLWAGNHAA